MTRRPCMRRNRLLPLTLTALGVVYGDIGTSPLYAMRECFFGSHSVPPTHDNVLGVLSLIIYSLLLVISIKYVAIVMRADNQGEGGVLALTALDSRPGRRWRRAVTAGRRPADPDRARHLRHGAALRRRHDHAGDHGARRRRRARGRDAAVPAVRRADHGRDSDRALSDSEYGTHRVGGLFGPIMVVWFVALAVLGVSVDRAPAGGARRVRSASCRRVLPRQRLHRLRRARRRVPRRHRRRSAVRRHGAFRQAADPPRVVRARAARRWC